MYGALYIGQTQYAGLFRPAIAQAPESKVPFGTAVSYIARSRSRAVVGRITYGKRAVNGTITTGVTYGNRK